MAEGTNQTELTRMLYPAYIALGIHGQENKWWSMYIYTTFNSILLVSASVLTTQALPSAIGVVAVVLLSCIGILNSVCWIIMGADYVAASDLFSDTAVAAEALFPDGIPKPLTRRNEQRKLKSGWGTTKFLFASVPISFILAHLIFVIMALLKSC